MIQFKESQIIQMHEFLITLAGGIKGVKDNSTLDYCVKSPFITFDGKDLYPSTMEKCVLYV